MPQVLHCNGVRYDRTRVLKHDFFAATGLYRGPHGPVICKLGRVADLFGFPLVWLGEWLCGREAAAYQRLRDVPGVPPFLGRFEKTGFVHDFVPGHDLSRDEPVGNGFFSQLDELIRAVHARDMAYVDLEKRENIIVGDDGGPHLIDFQICWYCPCPSDPRSAPARWLLRRFQESDRYHLLKHWRRHRPDQLTPQQILRSRRKPAYVRLHQRLTRPLTRIRRNLLQKLDPARATAR